MLQAISYEFLGTANCLDFACNSVNQLRVVYKNIKNLSNQPRYLYNVLQLNHDSTGKTNSFGQH